MCSARPPRMSRLGSERCVPRLPGAMICSRPQEQVLFRRLSVFVGGWSLEGTEAIASINGDTNTIDAVETLGRLIDHSLVETRSGADEAELRYSMLETIREFAVEQLEASGEARSCGPHSSRFLIDLATRAEDGLRGAQAGLLARPVGGRTRQLPRRLGRCARPRRWRRRSPTRLEAVGVLVDTWLSGAEGRSWLQRRLDIASDSDLTARAAAEYGLGRHSIILGNYEAASQHLQVSLALRRTLRDASGQAATLNELALVAVNRGELGQAAHASARKHYTSRARPTICAVLAPRYAIWEWLHVSRATTHARSLYGQSLAMWRQLNDPRWIAIVASSLGITHRYEGNTKQRSSC